MHESTEQKNIIISAFINLLTMIILQAFASSDALVYTKALVCTGL